MYECWIQQDRRHVAGLKIHRTLPAALPTIVLVKSFWKGERLLGWVNALGLFMSCGKEMASLGHYTPSTSEVIRPAKRHKSCFSSDVSFSSDVKCLSLMMLQHKPAVFSSVPFWEIDFFHITKLVGSHLLLWLPMFFTGFAKTREKTRISVCPLDSWANSGVGRPICNIKIR